MRTSLGEITELPRLPSWFSGIRFAAGEKEWGRRRKRRRKREGDSVPPLVFFLQFNHCQQCIVAATYTQSLDLALSLCVAQSVAIMQIDCEFFDSS